MVDVPDLPDFGNLLDDLSDGGDFEDLSFRLNGEFCELSELYHNRININSELLHARTFGTRSCTFNNLGEINRGRQGMSEIDFSISSSSSETSSGSDADVTIGGGVGKNKGSRLRVGELVRQTHRGKSKLTPRQLKKIIKDYRIPSDWSPRLAHRGERFSDCNDGFVALPVKVLEKGGLRLPVPRLFYSLCSTYNFCLSQIPPNAYRFVNGLILLVHNAGGECTLNILRHFLKMVQGSPRSPYPGLFHFQYKANLPCVPSGTPDTNREWRNYYFFVKDPCGFSFDTSWRYPNSTEFNKPVVLNQTEAAVVESISHDFKFYDFNLLMESYGGGCSAAVLSKPPIGCIAGLSRGSRAPSSATGMPVFKSEHSSKKKKRSHEVVAKEPHVVVKRGEHSKDVADRGRNRLPPTSAGRPTEAHQEALGSKRRRIEDSPYVADLGQGRGSAGGHLSWSRSAGGSSQGRAFSRSAVEPAIFKPDWSISSADTLFDDDKALEFVSHVIPPQDREDLEDDSIDSKLKLGAAALTRHLAYYQSLMVDVKKISVENGELEGHVSRIRGLRDVERARADKAEGDLKARIVEINRLTSEREHLQRSNADLAKEKDCFLAQMKSMEESHKSELEEVQKKAEQDIKSACLQAKKAWYDEFIIKESFQYASGFIVELLSLAFAQYQKGGWPEGLSFEDFSRPLIPTAADASLEKLIEESKRPAYHYDFLDLDEAEQEEYEEGEVCEDLKVDAELQVGTESENVADLSVNATLGVKTPPIDWSPDSKKAFDSLEIPSTSPPLAPSSTGTAVVDEQAHD